MMDTQKISIKQSLQQATKMIAQQLRLPHTEASIEARVLILHVLQKSHAWLICHDHQILSTIQANHLHNLLARRLEGEPIAYIVGYREFFGMLLKVSPATLIPRPDTEILVETALALIPANQTYQVVDLGTGSGAIGLAIAQQRPNCQVWATDFSQQALQIAEQNAQSLQQSNIHFKQGSWLEPLQSMRFHLIVSNPPYIAQHDAHLGQGDLRFEPLSALASGNDGLQDIRVIIQQSKQYLFDNGFLLLEHGFDQAQAIAEFAYQNHAKNVLHIKDLAGLDRVSQIQF